MRSLATRLPAMFCNMFVANNSSILQYCHGMSIKGVLVFYRTTEYANSWEEGGLNCEAKAQVLVVTPAPLFFLKVGRKKGGVTAEQYGTCSLWPVGGVWLCNYMYLLCSSESSNMYVYVAYNSSILQYCHGMSIYRTQQSFVYHST